MDRREIENITIEVAELLEVQTDVTDTRGICIVEGDDRIICVRYMGDGEAEIDWGTDGQDMQLRVGSAEDLRDQLIQLTRELLNERAAAASS